MLHDTGYTKHKPALPYRGYYIERTKSWGREVCVVPLLLMLVECIDRVRGSVCRPPSGIRQRWGHSHIYSDACLHSQVTLYTHIALHEILSPMGSFADLGTLHYKASSSIQHCNFRRLVRLRKGRELISGSIYIQGRPQLGSVAWIWCIDIQRVSRKLSTVCKI